MPDDLMELEQLAATMTPDQFARARQIFWRTAWKAFGDPRKYREIEPKWCGLIDQLPDVSGFVGLNVMMREVTVDIFKDAIRESQTRLNLEGTAQC